MRVLLAGSAFLSRCVGFGLGGHLLECKDRIDGLIGLTLFLWSQFRIVVGHRCVGVLEREPTGSVETVRRSADRSENQKRREDVYKQAGLSSR